MSKVKTNGYAIKQMIKRLTRERDALSGQFDKACRWFPEEGKEPPDLASIGYRLDHVETQIAGVQSMQADYNTTVMVNFLGNEITLACAIKLCGSRGRMAKKYKRLTGAEDKMNDRYFMRDDVRNAGQIYAEDTISQDVAIKVENEFSDQLAALQQAIATANATVVEIETYGVSEEAIPAV